MQIRAAIWLLFLENEPFPISFFYSTEEMLKKRNNMVCVFFFVTESQKGPLHFTDERSDLVSMLNHSSTSPKHRQPIVPNRVW